MFELIYVSHAHPEITSVDIDNILTTSQIFNSENDITGCLLFYNQNFVQILEGGQSVILELYRRIEKDDRHYDVTLLSMGYKPSRIFGQWSMLYQEIGNDEWSSLCLENNLKKVVGWDELLKRPSIAGQLFRSTVQRYLSV